MIEARLPIPAVFTLYPAPLCRGGGLRPAGRPDLYPVAAGPDRRHPRRNPVPRCVFRQSRRLPARPAICWPWLCCSRRFVGAAIWFSGTAFLTLWTAGGIAGALAILVLAAWPSAGSRGGSAPRARGRPALRLALGAIGARGGEATSVVLSLGLGLAVLAAVGQIDGNLRRSFANDLPDVAPSYFFVDIQPDQIDGFPRTAG